MRWADQERICGIKIAALLFPGGFQNSRLCVFLECRYGFHFWRSQAGIFLWDPAIFLIWNGHIRFISLDCRNWDGHKHSYINRKWEFSIKFCFFREIYFWGQQTVSARTFVIGGQNLASVSTKLDFAHINNLSFQNDAQGVIENQTGGKKEPNLSLSTKPESQCQFSWRGKFNLYEKKRFPLLHKWSRNCQQVLKALH